MKLFSYLLVACAGLGLFACNTENDPVIENGDGVTKSVSLKLNGISGSLNTKAVEPGTTGATGATENIILQDLKIIFFDKDATGGPIYRTETFSATANPTEWAELTGAGDGHVFHNLDPMVDKVIVIGNWQGGKNFTWTNVDAIKTSVLLAAEENQLVGSSTTTKGYVTLWGEAVLAAADPTFTDTSHGPDANVSKWEAPVHIAPLVARMEIGNIQCTDLNVPPALYSSFDLAGIGLIDISLSNSINGPSGTPVGPGLSTRLVVPTNILEPGSTADEPNQKYVFGTGSIAWAFNGFADVHFDSAGDIYNPDTDKKFVYNFFPDPAGFPNIKLVLNDVTTVGGGLSGFNYVVTARFTEATVPLAGYIYKVDFKFLEEHIGPWDPDDFKCVIVDVTVEPWHIMTLTPEFE